MSTLSFVTERNLEVSITLQFVSCGFSQVFSLVTIQSSRRQVVYYGVDAKHLGKVLKRMRLSTPIINRVKLWYWLEQDCKVRQLAAGALV